MLRSRLRSRLAPASLRLRLITGFAAAMAVVLIGAAGFVYWRVQVALDRSLSNELDLRAQSLRSALTAGGALTNASLEQVLRRDGTVFAATPDGRDQSLLPPALLPSAARRTLTTDRGHLLIDGNRRLRIQAFPVSAGGPEVLIGVVAAPLAQHDEALRELLAQLAIANLAALAVAGLVGYRLAKAALSPVERYRQQAEQIAEGATGVRLSVPPDAEDEVSRLGATLNAMLSAQERTADAQRQFLADASHELRTPLAIVSSSIELALSRPRSQQQYETTLRHLAHDTTRLVRLSEQLLSLERSQAQPMRPAEPYSVAACLERAAHEGRRSLPEDARQIHTSAPPDAQVGIDSDVLQQVLHNLTANAVLHGQGTIRITAEHRSDRLIGPLLVLTVHDEGTTMPSDFVPHALDRFRRADPARTTPGNGLGLAIVQSLVQQAAGELRMCRADKHHSYPPVRFAATPCAHPSSGLTVSVLMSDRQATTS